MVKIKDLSQGNLGDVARQQHRDQYSTPLNGSSVGSGGMRFYGTGELTVENEGLNVTGMATITGALNVSGSTILSGSTTIAGPTGITGTLTVQGATTVSGDFTVTGPTKLNGNTTVGGDLELIAGGLFKAGSTEIRPDGSAKFGLFEIAANGDLVSKGTLEIDGVTTLKKDLNVTTGGKIVAGVTKIEPSGKATFGDFIIDPSSQKLISAPGGQLFSNGPDSIGLSSSTTSSVNLSGTVAELNYNGQTIRLTTADTIISNRLTVSLAAEVKGNMIVRGATVLLTSLPTTTNAANLFINPTTGQLFRSTA